MRSYELRDPVHKRISFDDFEKTIIDHPFVQRLRFIGQLSFVQTYVYPGGLHNRFVHVLGAMHVAGRLFGHFVKHSKVLKERFNDEEIVSLRRRVRLAGLLHDIGHGPFSHASETVFPKFHNLPLKKEWWYEQEDRKAKHEDYSVLLIQTLADEGVLEQDLAQDIASLVHGGVKPSSTFLEFEKKAPTIQKVLKAIISGEVDCDRMDYLLRDSYYCGVAYGHYDIDWMISSLGIAEQEGELVFTIAENGVRAFEDLLLARYHMIDQVYFHKTKAGFNYFLEQAIQMKEIDLLIPTDPYAYAELRDGKVIEQLFESAKHTQNYWSHHLMRRKPAKHIVRLHDSNEEDVTMLQTLKNTCEAAQVKHFTYAAASKLSEFGGEKEETMMYVAKKTVSGIAYIPISEYSDLLLKYNERLKFTDFFVHREDLAIFKTLDISG